VRGAGADRDRDDAALERGRRRDRQRRAARQGTHLLGDRGLARREARIAQAAEPLLPALQALRRRSAARRDRAQLRVAERRLRGRAFARGDVVEPIEDVAQVVRARP